MLNHLAFGKLPGQLCKRQRDAVRLSSHDLHTSCVARLGAVIYLAIDRSVHYSNRLIDHISILSVYLYIYLYTYL